jgi:membrane protease YdiL (CAAX protease family)
MEDHRRSHQQHALRTGIIVKFFSLTYLVTWTFFFTAIALPHGTPATDQDFAVIRGGLLFAGTIAPALLALAITARASPTSGTTLLLHGLFRWRLRARWYLFAVSYMAAIKLTVAFAHRMMTGLWPRVGPWSVGTVLVAIIVSTPFQAGEEIGWRGYALPRLAESIGLARGSVVLGIVWACWHLPLFFLQVPGNEEYGQSFPVWALGVTGLSVAIAWLYAHTGGSLLITMLMHSAVNNIPHFSPSPAADVRNIFSLKGSSVAWLTAIFLAIAAACMLPGMRHIGSSNMNSSPRATVDGGDDRN